MMPSGNTNPGDAAAGQEPALMKGDRPQSAAADPALSYHLVEQLGGTALEPVILVERANRDRRSVIKFMRLRSDSSLEELAQFRAAAIKARATRNPYLVPVLGFGYTETAIAYVETEWMDGTSLSDLIEERGAFPLPIAIRVARQVGEGVRAGHEAGLVYGAIDAKRVIMAGNLEHDPTALLLPFAISDLQIGRRATGATYTSPERAADEALDRRTDVYALGCLLHHMATGAPPVAAEPFEQIVAELDSANTSGVAPHVIERVAHVIAKSLAISPERRFQEVTAFCNAIRLARDSEPKTIPPPVVSAPAVASGPAPRGKLAVPADAHALEPLPPGLAATWAANAATVARSIGRTMPRFGGFRLQIAPRVVIALMVLALCAVSLIHMQTRRAANAAPPAAPAAKPEGGPESYSAGSVAESPAASPAIPDPLARPAARPAPAQSPAAEAPTVAPLPSKAFRVPTIRVNAPDASQTDIVKRVTDATEFSSKPVAAAATDGLGSTSAIGDQLYSDALVDKPARPLPGSASPHYPSWLEKAGVGGGVLAQFVVDTNGLVDPASFKVIKSSDNAFTKAVKDALPGMRFTPAEEGGQRVKELVELPFTFGAPK